MSKTVNGVEHTYLYEGGLLVQETRDKKVFDYSYDASGNLTMLRYKSSPTASAVYFYYALNLRGDVIGLYNSSGDLMAKYTYDVWGNEVSVTNASGGPVSDGNIAKLQPFRYRSYYLDTESNFYYLQSRYYDPVTHRFINADTQLNQKDGVLGFNMFAYCNNNPIIYSDPTGHSIVLTCIIVGAIIGAVAGGSAGAYISKKQTGRVNGWAVALGAVGGAVVGGLAGWGFWTAITAFGATTTGTAIASSAPAIQHTVEQASTAIQPYYPPNDGFYGSVQKITLEVGTIIQRTGSLAGKFVAPAGTPQQMLSLPYDKIGQPTTFLKVEQSLEVFSGRVAPWFGQVGGGIQYKLINPLEQLISEGIISIIGG